MRGARWIFLALVLALFGSACTSLKTESVSYVDYPPALNDANFYYKNQNYERAESEVQRYLTTNSEVYWYGHAYLLLGEIRENSGQEAQAEEAYKKALSHAAGYHGAVTAKSLYRLSWIYERQMKYDVLLVTLLDLERALGQNDNFIKLVETPARLANVYYILNQWDNAHKQRARVTDAVMDRFHSAAKTPADLYQAHLYRSFLGMKPLPGTPPKSQEILALTQKEILDFAEMADDRTSQRAYTSLEMEYERYLTKVKQLAPAKNPVETAQRNETKLLELAQYVDSIEDLRAVRRPIEVVVNKKHTLAFFKKLVEFEKTAKALASSLQIGVQKAKRSGNPQEPAAEPPAKKKPAPAQNKAL